MPKSYKSKYKWILTVIDHCTLWPVAVPMREATSAAIAEALLEHVITPFGLPKELLTDRGLNFLSGGLTRFLKAGKIHKLNTLGYHPRTNGKNERYNGILLQAILTMNDTGDPSKWEDFLPAALFSTQIHVSDSSGMSPFELVYGVKPRPRGNRPTMVADNAALPGQLELQERIKKLNEKRLEGLSQAAQRSDWNKAAFDSSAKFARNLERFAVGESVKLRNKSHTKGTPRWYGPFEIKKALDNNVYILVDQNGEDYSRPVNGNDLRPVLLQSLISNEMWSTPPAMAQKAKRAKAKVERTTMKKAKAITTLPPPTTSRFRVKFDGRFLRPPTTGSRTDPS
jgi:transposase InsO family protein